MPVTKRHRLQDRKPLYPHVAVQLATSGMFMDRDESIFGALELEEVSALISRIDYPELKAKRLIPVTAEGGEYATTFAYREWDATGVAKFIANPSDDVPMVNIRGKKYRVDIHIIGLGFSYSILDIARAAHANIPLPTEDAERTREGVEQFIEQTAWLGDAPTGRIGFFYSPNITVSKVTTGVGGFTWAQKTPDEILYDLNLLYTQPIALTKGIEVPDTILLPITQYNLADSTPRASGDGRSILEVFRKNHPGVTVEWLNQLSSDSMPTNPLDGGSPVNCMIAYKKAPGSLQLVLPSSFKTLPPQQNNMAYKVIGKAHYGDVVFRKPLGVNLVTGI